MSDLSAALITLAVIAVLAPLAAWAIRNAKRSKRAMAPLAGMIEASGGVALGSARRRHPQTPAESGSWPSPGRSDVWAIGN
jgi:Tfp pilus assembly protein FimT